MAVDGGLADDLPVGARIDGAVLIAVYVAAQHVGDAMGIDATQVGEHQNVGTELGVIIGYSKVPEYAGDR